MTFRTRSLVRASRTVALALIAGSIPLACADQVPTDAVASSGSTPAVEPPPPIATEALSGRHEFTDQIAAQLRLKPTGRPLDVANLQDGSRLAVLKITVQPGARFPWHTHPGPVLVAIAQGDLVYVYGDDCVERTYPTGTGLVDPGNNMHYAFNPTAGETILVATFLGVPATGPLTIPVATATATALDQKCGIAPAALHSH